MKISILSIAAATVALSTSIMTLAAPSPVLGLDDKTHLQAGNLGFVPLGQILGFSGRKRGLTDGSLNDVQANILGLDILNGLLGRRDIFGNVLDQATDNIDHGLQLPPSSGPHRRDLLNGLLNGAVENTVNYVLSNGVGSILSQLSYLPVDVDVTDTIQRIPVVGKILSPILIEVLGDFHLDIKAFIKLIATITDPMDPNANLVEQIVGKVNASVYAALRAKVSSHETKDGRGIVPKLVGPIDVDASATVTATIQV
ncbi:hypothetical protein H4219_005502 [Mycoemilia scoparia]|uniref:Uncharacterized protein n=1 Tax=Mycoemilia scoparia TaxID=417184 RepID=A0A9W7ZNV0_9FUNG|nr:hypothetical protein H4219_005502 [Mycoemilia scoparia]